MDVEKTVKETARQKDVEILILLNSVDELQKIIDTQNQGL